MNVGKAWVTQSSKQSQRARRVGEWGKGDSTTQFQQQQRCMLHCKANTHATQGRVRRHHGYAAVRHCSTHHVSQPEKVRCEGAVLSRGGCAMLQHCQDKQQKMCNKRERARTCGECVCACGKRPVPVARLGLAQDLPANTRSGCGHGHSPRHNQRGGREETVQRGCAGMSVVERKEETAVHGRAWDGGNRASVWARAVVRHPFRLAHAS